MHQLAKDQALGQYYAKLENGINPAGVRQQDLDGWQKKLQDWQQYAIENRDNLINPNRDGGRAQRQFGAMHQDLLGDIQKSKAAAQNERAVQTIMLDPKRRAMTTNKDLDLAHKMSASIYDPNHFKEDGVTPVAPEDFSFNAPPYDIKKQSQINAFATRGLKQSYGKATGVDPTTGAAIVPLKHSIENLKTIAERTGQAYDSDQSMQQHYDNMPADPDTLDKLNKAYKTVYPNDEVGTDPRKHAMAEGILNNQESSTVLKPIYHPPQPKGLTKAQQDQQLMLGLTNGLANAIKTGNVSEAKRLGGVWFSGNGKSAYQDIDQGALTSGMAGLNPKPGFIVKHVDKQWVPDDPKDPSKGSYKEVLNTTELDPTDPQLVNKIANLHQTFMGSTPALEKGVVGQVMGQTPPPSTKPTAPAAKPATTKDPLNLFQ